MEISDLCRFRSSVKAIIVIKYVKLMCGINNAKQKLII